MPSAPTAQEVFKEIKKIVRLFNEWGLADRSFEPVLGWGPGGLRSVEGPVPTNSQVLKNITYEELYATLEEEHRYLIKLIDGGLLQLDYFFDSAGRKLQRHRLAYLPSPHLDPYMELEDDYWAGRAFVEIVGHQVMPVPIRVDFDGRPGVAVSMNHPAAHMTLGQYQHCRIPLSSPVLPGAFVAFIAMHFYSDGVLSFSEWQGLTARFPESISLQEQCMMHLKVP